MKELNNTGNLSPIITFFFSYARGVCASEVLGRAMIRSVLEKNWKTTQRVVLSEVEGPHFEHITTGFLDKLGMTTEYQL